MIDLPIVLRPKKRSAIGLLAPSALFVFVGFLMRAERPLVACLCIAFFSLGVVVGVVQLLPGSTFLRLDPAGIHTTSLFRHAPPIEWSSVAEFGIVVIRNHGIPINKMVGMNFVPAMVSAKTARKVSKAISGFDGALPNTYGWKAEELVELLREIQRQQFTKEV
jgi:hypothetical protein